MGSIKHHQKQHRGRSPGKIDSPLNEKLKNVKWGEFKLGDLFVSQTGDVDLQQKDCNEKGLYLINSGLENYGIKGKTDRDAKVFESNTITIDFWGNAFYRNFKYKMATHNHVFSLSGEIIKNEKIGVFLATQLSSFRNYFSYGNMGTWNKMKDMFIQLPLKEKSLDFSNPCDNIKNIDFDFMESFIRELEEERIRELNAYLLATGLKDYTLTPEEENALEAFNTMQWEEYNLENLYGKSTRGKRLKSEDRIKGDLPFVTAGEADTGISDYISNDVEIFSKNTTTIDMFGSAKYRNHNYGADDHVAVVHTEDLPKHSSIFVTSAIHKSSHTGKFDYSNNFYASDADELNIQLPTKDGKPDYAIMETFIKAIEKLVIKDVVLYADSKIEATKNVVKKDAVKYKDKVLKTHIDYSSNSQDDSCMVAENMPPYK